MTGKKWRSVSTRLVEEIRRAMETEPLKPVTEDSMTIANYRDMCELYRRVNAEAQLETIKVLLNVFEKHYLNPESADDFDEYEEGAIV